MSVKDGDGSSSSLDGFPHKTQRAQAGSKSLVFLLSGPLEEGAAHI